MSKKESPRAGLIRACLKGTMTNAEAARTLELSVRQFIRIKARFQAEGVRGLLHRLRCSTGRRRTSEAIAAQVIELMRTTYRGFNDCHLTEKLGEQHGLTLSRATVRRLRLSQAIEPKQRRRPPKHRSRRERAAAEGILVQIDGSDHDWLEGRGPRMCLLGATDDATGRWLALHFRPTEDMHGYATLLHQVFTHHGLPLRLYGDGTGVLVPREFISRVREDVIGKPPPTQLGRALQELGIDFIRARSPQAKGRIENRWRTLQDRLVSELRLRGIQTREEANRYLPTFLEDFNRRFAVEPRETTVAWRKAPARLNQLLACRYHRVVARDNTVSLPQSPPRASTNLSSEDLLAVQRSCAPRLLQIPKGPRARSYAGLKVEIRELLTGELLVTYQGRQIARQPSPDPNFILVPRARGRSRSGSQTHDPMHRPQPRVNVTTDKPRRENPVTRIPATDHPWRVYQATLKSTFPT